MKNKLEIIFWRFAIYLIKKGYGKGCDISDLDEVFTGKDIFYKDGQEMKMSEIIIHPVRCSSCRAKETVLFIEEHIYLLED